MLLFGFFKECKTRPSHRGLSEPCVFPFIFNNVEYSTCTDENSRDDTWCATKTDAQGNMIPDQWGKCDIGCPGFRGKCQDFIHRLAYKLLNFQD